MRKIGTVDLPLHTGKAPKWLFDRMCKLSAEVLYIIALEFGAEEIVKKLADPFWLQAFGCLLGFDWHSSGLTTTVMGAVKEALKRHKELGVFVAGGKGKRALTTPEEIDKICDKFGIEEGEKFITLSRLVAKIDSSALQDGFKLYHHTFIFTQDGRNWAVVQQGMDPVKKLARRYHWLSEKVKKLTIEPHYAICCDEKREVLNLVASGSEKLQKGMVELVKEKPDKVIAEMELVKLSLPRRHHIEISDIDKKRFWSVLEKAYEQDVKRFEELLLVKGTGEKFLRALALTSELIYGTPVSYKDPVRYSFAHGGKDGHPFPVKKYIYDHTIEVLKEAVSKAKIGEYEKLQSLKRLSKLTERIAI